MRRKFERDKSELRELGVVLETRKVAADHTDQEVEGYLLRPKDFYLPYLELRTVAAPRSEPYFLHSIRVEPDELAAAELAAQPFAR